MAKIVIQFPPGATLLDPDEIGGLIPDYISLQSELNVLEKENVAAGIDWSHSQKDNDVLTSTFIFTLHRKMFGDVWKWAGKPRASNKSIGISKEQILQALGALLKNVEYWITHKTYSNEEIAVRFHHRLVEIHVFNNGNGRHARLMTDLLLRKLGEREFSWGESVDV
ncbi:MAG: mobile mystery protein B, partial [Bdellovibrionota bacterium]